MSAAEFIALALIVVLIVGAVVARVLFWAASEDPRGPKPHTDDEA